MNVIMTCRQLKTILRRQKIMLVLFIFATFVTWHAFYNLSNNEQTSGAEVRVEKEAKKKTEHEKHVQKGKKSSPTPAKKKKCTYIHDKEIDFPRSVDLSSRKVHVAVLLDKKLTNSVLNSLNSLFRNTKADVHLHIITCGLPQDQIYSFLACHQIQNFTLNKVDFIQFNESWLKEVDFKLFATLSKSKTSKHLVTCGNFMRFFIQRLLPGVKRLVYMDTDMIVQGDIAELDYYTRNLKKSVAVTKRRNKEFKLSDAFPEGTKKIYEDKFKGETFDMGTTSFCNGVFVANLEKWRKDEKKMLKKLDFWLSVAVEQNKTESAKQWWFRPTQSLMQLVFNNDYDWIPDRNWHSEGLGFLLDLCDEHLKKAKLLHWNGHRKPWDGEAYPEYWNAYAPKECSGHGKCRQNLSKKQPVKYHCDCDNSYKGTTCQSQTKEHH